MKLHREVKGVYYTYNFFGEKINLFRIKRGLWGYSIGHSMTKGTARTLRELKIKLKTEI